MDKKRTVLVEDDDSMMREMPKMDRIQASGEDSPNESRQPSDDGKRVREALLPGASGFVVSQLLATSVLDRNENSFKGRVSQ